MGVYNPASQLEPSGPVETYDFIWPGDCGPSKFRGEQSLKTLRQFHGEICTKRLTTFEGSGLTKNAVQKIIILRHRDPEKVEVTGMATKQRPQSITSDTIIGDINEPGFARAVDDLRMSCVMKLGAQEIIVRDWLSLWNLSKYLDPVPTSE
ncbi:hypothetical protein BKA67DRAFT_535607 [Truncatella angustata]|uniref:Uncharacterized protein n=1 Tax=Truncatella angustata TaxID=152316 RepID=A0A9P8ZYQ9_9PEZI|nr:uncharacterized protein BKA67DRAFT_535607 [Truncatella angustata]KAH6654276.1 hypothetical protein BKA67DRAFT_535607 [Truncatella angustata]